jgi:hypothetical protein
VLTAPRPGKGGTRNTEHAEVKLGVLTVQRMELTSYKPGLEPGLGYGNPGSLGKSQKDHLNLHLFRTISL